MLKISLLGPFQLLYNDQPLKFAALPKTLPLWAYLLLHANTPLPRTTVAYTLWPDGDEAEARSNLRRHLYELRRVLPSASVDCPWLLTDNQHVQWNSVAPYWLDVDAFTQASADPASWATAVQIYRGELLPDLDEEWIFLARERLHNRYCDTLQALIDHCRHSQDARQAISYAQQLLQQEPLREDVVRELMSLRQASGDRAGALQEYRSFEQRLRSELDVAPMVETSALYDTIARQLPPPESSPPVPSPAPAPSSAVVEAQSPSLPHNLPAQ